MESLPDLTRREFQLTYGREPEFIARAPGRIEFIGNHTDYNGGTVLGAAIDRSVCVGLARRNDGARRFATDQGRPAMATNAGRVEKHSGAGSWVNYPIGVLAAFPEFGLRVPAGFDFLALSDVPPGAGLSSSAAIELASALVFAAAAAEQPEREVLVKVARHAENHFVGVPCGILDQGVSGFGKKDHLVLIDCRGPRFTTVALPPGVHFWIFNTHTRHALVDGLYAARHRECMEAAKTLGVALLAEVSQERLVAVEDELPSVLRRRAKHVVEEIARVDACVAGLAAGDLVRVGLLLTASHLSSRLLFENSTAELDFLVERLAVAPNVSGARLTGGGFGGAVMAMTSGEFADDDAQRIAGAYAKKFGAQPEVLHVQTADGAELIRF